MLKLREQQFLDINDNWEIGCSLNETTVIGWFINGKHQQVSFTSGKRIRVKENGNLIIEKVQLTDGGTYECRGLKYAKYYTIYVNGG